MTTKSTTPLALVLLLGLALPCWGQIERRNAITQAIDKSRSAIVNLKTLRVIPARFENVDAGRVKGLGTGVVFDPRGYIVTNYHVVEDVDEIEARTADGVRFPASIIETDRRNDLAILKIHSAREIPAMSLVGAGNGILGETVIAIGNPYGLDNSVTIGIVSAIDRELKLPNGEVFQGLIQTDASINPGNSGGPLITIGGELLGINVAIRSNAQGIAFAIPTARVREIIADMMKSSGGLSQIGVNVEEDPILPVGGVPTVPSGTIKVRAIEPGSFAERAGLKLGDEVVAAAGQQMPLRFDLDRVFWDRKDGEHIPVKIRRQGSEQELVLRVGSASTDESFLWDQVGIKVRPVVDAVRRVQPKWEGGLLMMEVQPESPAERAGFRPGDILAGLHDRMVLEPKHIRLVMKMPDFGRGEPIRFHLIRDGRVESGQITFPPAK